MEVVREACSGDADVNIRHSLPCDAAFASVIRTFDDTPLLECRAVERTTE
jgi:hypothetical protein